jgi:hypothetical protein
MHQDVGKYSPRKRLSSTTAWSRREPAVQLILKPDVRRGWLPRLTLTLDGMVELPFGVRMSVSFLHLLRRKRAKALIESPAAVPSLCAEERVEYQRSSSSGARVDLSKEADIIPSNRLAQPEPARPVVLSKDRFWVLRFKKLAQSTATTFEVCGMRLHISKKAQVELKGGTLYSALDKIFVRYDRRI